MKKIKNKIIIICTAVGALFALLSGVVLAVETKLLTPIPGAEQAVTKVTGMAEYLVSMYKFGLAAVGILAMGMIMFGGFMYITGSYTGMVGKTADGKEIIKSALTGLAIGLLSWMLINTIDPKLTKVRDILLTPPSPSASEQAKIEQICKEDCKYNCGRVGKNATPPFVENEGCLCKCFGGEDSCTKPSCELGVNPGEEVKSAVWDGKKCICEYTEISEEDQQGLCNLECQKQTCDVGYNPVATVTDDGCDCKCVESGEVTTPEIDFDEEDEEVEDGEEEISWTTVESEDGEESGAQLPDTDSEDEDTDDGEGIFSFPVAEGEDLLYDQVCTEWCNNNKDDNNACENIVGIIQNEGTPSEYCDCGCEDNYID